MVELPVYLWAITLVGVVAILGSTCLVLARGAQRAGLGRASAALLGGVAALLLGGWAVVSGIIAASGGYHARFGHQPLWLPVAVVGALTVTLTAARTPWVVRAVGAPGMLRSLTLPHTFRVAGVCFLITMALGHLPPLFALPAGLGDIATGVAAPFVARRLTRGAGHRAAVWFNVMGLTDLVVALALGGLTASTLVGVAPSADANLWLPLALIPTAVVPLLIVMHITSLRRLSAVARTASAHRGSEAVGVASS
jgi:hypothetical protein